MIAHDHPRVLDGEVGGVPESWRDALADVLVSDRVARLRDALRREFREGHVIFPPRRLWFAALRLTPPESVRVVILGQDPYHGPGQAHGLAFSVPPGMPIPPSLRNIMLERQSDLGLPPPSHGCLASWAREGVLLLNTVLTVRAGEPGSHAGLGWEAITDAIIRHVVAGPPCVFLLWGRHAQAKAALIRCRRHLVLPAAHPSPFAAHRGFFGTQPFSRANAWLRAQGRGEVSWRTDPHPMMGTASLSFSASDDTVRR